MCRCHPALLSEDPLRVAHVNFIPGGPFACPHCLIDTLTFIHVNTHSEGRHVSQAKKAGDEKKYR